MTSRANRRSLLRSVRRRYAGGSTSMLNDDRPQHDVPIGHQANPAFALEERDESDDDGFSHAAHDRAITSRAHRWPHDISTQH